MINATKDYYVPGMSGSVAYALYGEDLSNLIHTNKCCRPKEDVLFNDDQVFKAGKYYMVEIDEAMQCYTVYNSIRSFINGWIHLSKEEFNLYFILEED